jgi:predicted amidohydrolase YtcJ
MRFATGSVLIAIFLFACAQASRAETLLYPVRAWSWTASGLEEFSAIVFSADGRIVATGDERLVERYPGAVRINGRDRFVLPGLIDAHAHVLGLGLLRQLLNLAGAPSVEAAVSLVGDFARANPGRGWLLGRGWNQVLWAAQEFPLAAQLDAVVSDRPVWLRRIDGHAGWANSRALSLAGIEDGTPDPVGGRIVRDPRGRATGVLVDRAMDLVEAQIPPSTKDDIRAAYRAAIAELASLGLTSVHDTGIGIGEAEVYMAMADDGELHIRIYAMLAGAGDNLDALGKPLIGYGNDRLDIRAVKLYADGALGSRGAALLEPYSDDPENDGLRLWTQAELEGFVARANERGFQAAIHAIGDRGNRMALDAFATVQGGRPSPLRNRVEHAQIIALEDIPRFAELGVIASMQPTHATSDMNMAEDRIGPERIQGGYAWRRLLESGAVIAAGSDFPVELPNPFHGLYAAVTRRDRAGMPEGGWYADQALSRAEALRAFTLDAARAAHQEAQLGSLEVGKWADFIVIDRDYFSVPAKQIGDIRVLETWVGGQRVYAAPGRN